MPTLDAHIVKARRVLTVDMRLRLEQGERLALFGASGAGKSTVSRAWRESKLPTPGGFNLATRLSFRRICRFTSARSHT